MNSQNKVKNIFGFTALLALSLLIVSVLPTHILRPKRVQAVVYSPLNNMRPKDHAIVRKDGVWHVFSIYVCIDQSPPCDTTTRGLMHLTSTDLKNWTEVGYVVPPGGGSTWDADDIWAPSIVEKDGTYYMYYTGVDLNGSGTFVQKIGVATSTDLTNWAKSGSNPVVDCSTFSWAYWDPTNNADGAACRDPYVSWDPIEHQWVMLVAGRTAAGTMVVGIATSENLTTWREYGMIATTAQGTIESAHIIQHSGTNYVVYTDNCSPQPCIKYVSSTTSLYTGYSAETSTTLESNAYASEYIKDHGREYFTRVDGTTNEMLDFDEVAWSGSPFTVQEVSYGKIGDFVWNDADGDTVQDAGEAGIDAVSLSLYLDDGDGFFDPTSDDLYRSVTSGDDPNTVGTQHGYYQFTEVIPGIYWVVINPSNYASGGALAGKVATTTNTVTKFTVTDNQVVSNQDIGFQSIGTTWPLSTGGNFSTSSEVSLSNGRATTTPFSNAVSWWHPDYQYRRQITVNAGSEALTNTHTINIGLTLSTLVSAGKVQADFDDVRMVYWNGSANQEIDLDLIDGTTERFKLQVSVSASGSDGNYYLYYGNPDAVLKPTQLAKVYDYYSSFNAKDAATYSTWAESDEGNWAISANKWRYNATTVFDRYTRDTAKTINMLDEWNIEANVVINSGDVGGLTFHDPDGLDDGVHDKYHINFSNTFDNVRYWRWANGEILPATSFAVAAATDYRVNFRYLHPSCSTRTLSVLVNNAAIGTSRTENDCAYDTWYADGQDTAHFALNTFNANVSFNDVKGWQEATGLTVTDNGETQYYPVRNGTINPVAGQAQSFAKLVSFSTVSAAQGGTVNFVLSNDGGTSWLYWNGTAWVSSNSTLAQSNPASTINTQAASFPSGSQQFLWRSVMDASSDQKPVLLHVGSTLNQVPGAPTLISPADGATASTTRPTLTFSATDADSDALQYQVQIDTTNTFNSANLQTITQSSSQTGWSGQNASAGTAYTSGTTASLTVPDALVGRQYYWRVRAVDPSGSNVYSSYSSTRSLTGPTTLTLTEPVLSGRSSTGVIISWTTNLPASSRVEYGLTTAYGSVVATSTLLTSHSLLVTDLTPSTTYHFRVLSTDASTQTVASADHTFTTTRLTSLAPPVIIRPADQMVTYSSQPLITGLALSGKTVFLFLDDDLLTTVKATNDESGVGHFFFRMTTSLRSGAHTLQAITRDDKTRELSAYTKKRLFYTFPQSAPTILNPPEGSATRRERVIVQGLSWREHDVRIYLDGRFAASITPPDRKERTSVFTYETPRLLPGEHTVYARHRAPDGTIGGRSKLRTFTIVAPDYLYTVRVGDTLRGVAQRFLGDDSRYPEILWANQDRYPQLSSQLRLTPGQVLRIFVKKT